jgi:methionine-rich copper-binding protein CopC
MSSFPVVDQVMDGSATSFAIRFDQPVDHVRSRLILVTPQGERALQPRRETEPNTLFSPVGRLPPGAYELRWEAVEMGGAVARGTIPFRVAHP